MCMQWMCCELGCRTRYSAITNLMPHCHAANTMQCCTQNGPSLNLMHTGRGVWEEAPLDDVLEQMRTTTREMVGDARVPFEVGPSYQP